MHGKGGTRQEGCEREGQNSGEQRHYICFKPPSLWPEGIGLFPSALLYPVPQHSEPSNELAQGTAKTLTSRQEIPDLLFSPEGLSGL